MQKVDAKGARAVKTATGAPPVPTRSPKPPPRKIDRDSTGQLQRMPGVSATVALRGKQIAGHQRAHQARQQARRGRG